MIESVNNLDNLRYYIFNDLDEGFNKTNVLSHLVNEAKFKLGLKKPIFKTDLNLEIKDSSKHRSNYYLEAFRNIYGYIVAIEFFGECPNWHHVVFHIEDLDLVSKEVLNSLK